MPIEEDHTIMTLPSFNTILWRYMDIPSFLSLLVNESLTFVRSDLFEDKFEGTLPKMTATMIDEEINKKIENGVLKAGYRNLSEILNTECRTTYLNCWCKENHEMVHMWKIYSKENGIAIETNYNLLKNSLETNETILATEINYIDFGKDEIDFKANGLTVYTIKRKEYKSENEVRLILSYPDFVEKQINFKASESKIHQASKNLYLQTPIIKCKVNLSKLISKIHISPYAPKWYYEIIVDLIKKYNLDVNEIIQSDL